MLAEIAKKRAQAAHAQAQAGHAQMLGTAAIAKVGLEQRRQIHDERNAAFDHAHQLHDRMLAAHDQGHRHAMEIADAHDQRAEALHSPFPSPLWGGGGGGADDSQDYFNHRHPDGSQALAVDPPHKGEGREPSSAEPDFIQQLIDALRAPRPPVEFVRDPATGRIAGARYLHPQLPPPHPPPSP